MSASSAPLHHSFASDHRRRGRPVARTTFQLACDVLPNKGQSQAAALAEVQTLSLKWANRRFPSKLDEAAWEGNSFLCLEPGYRLEAIRIADDRVWTMRLEHPDHDVARRNWTVDLSFRETDRNTLQMALRLQCVSGDDVVEPEPFSRPGIVKGLVEHFTLQELLPFSGKPWTIEAEADLSWLLRFLQDERRTLPVYVLSQVDQWVRNDFVIDADDLAVRVQSVAHVIKVPYGLGYAWTQLVGRQWSSFNGAIRTFRPGFDRETDSISDHPRILGERIQRLRVGERVGPAAVADMLEQQAFLHSAGKNLDLSGCLFLEDARTRQAELARSAASESDDWRSLFEDEISALNAKIAKLGEQVEDWQTLAEQADQERNYYSERNGDLRVQADGLRAALEAKTGESTDERIPILDDYAELEEWVNTHLAGRLELHPRARRSLSGAVYGDVALVYRSLLLLGREYRNMKLGYPGAKEAFEDGTAALGLRCGGSIAKHLAGEQGETYFVNYPPHSVQKHFVDLHIRKGSDHDERNCLAIYYFWHDETQQVIVSWLPGHLKNRRT